MTVERTVEVGSASIASGGATFVALAQGTSMDQWVMWVMSTAVAIVGAYGAFRLTTESRLTYLETRIKETATTTDIATVKGELQKLASDLDHRRDVMDRMDARLEAIAARLGVM